MSWLAKIKKNTSRTSRRGPAPTLQMNFKPLPHLFFVRKSSWDFAATFPTSFHPCLSTGHSCILQPPPLKLLYSAWKNQMHAGMSTFHFPVTLGWIQLPLTHSQKTWVVDEDLSVHGHACNKGQRRCGWQWFSENDCGDDKKEKTLPSWREGSSWSDNSPGPAKRGPTPKIFFHVKTQRAGIKHKQGSSSPAVR